LDEPEAVRSARVKGADLGCTSVSGATAALLSILAATLGAHTVVEVGTGTGISAAALLAGMNDDGILTSIDVEAENQRVARELLTALGYDHVRTRLIAGRPIEVLSRMTDDAYDIAFVNADAAEYPAILHQAQRLLRPGGMVIFSGVQPTGAGGRDPETVAINDIVATVRDADHWLPMLLPVGSGVLAAVLRT
jgi:predicted O-methyltransferase YrrM